jgi:dTDP-4-dehydrorhamnose 3,5-epimerase
MEIIKTKLDGVLLIKPKVFGDNRGFFLESHSQRTFAQNGIDTVFVQDNHSYSSQKGVLRGMHYQRTPHTQTKLVRVTRGAVYDVALDLRKNSATYGQWEGFELSAENFHMLYIPHGFAHGFCTMTEHTEFHYKNDQFYEPSAEGGILWNDPTLKISWPVTEPILSEKDKKLTLFSDFISPF